MKTFNQKFFAIKQFKVSRNFSVSVIVYLFFSIKLVMQSNLNLKGALINSGGII